VSVAPNSANLTVTIPALEEAASVQPAAPGTAVAPITNAAEPEQPRRWSTQKTVGIAVGGVGVVGLVVGTVFGLKAKSKQHDSEAYCHGDNNTLCSQPGLDLLDQGHCAATISNVSFALGGAALIGGAVLFLTAPSSGGAAPATGSSVRVQPEVGMGNAGLVLRGKF
jgi:hypothetical protein